MGQLYKIVPEKLTSNVIQGYDFNQGVDYSKIMESMQNHGLQASNLHSGIKIINKMLKWRLSDEPID
jgi:deoxyhypusine synthase